MKEHALLKLLFVLIWALAIAHMTAEYYHLYWTYRWLDIPMHFVGGVWVALAMVWFCFRSGYVRNVRPLFSLFTAAVIGGLLIGLAWELYEFVVWQVSGSGLPYNYLQDTLMDLTMDLLGGFFAYTLLLLLKFDTNTGMSSVVYIQKTPA